MFNWFKKKKERRIVRVFIVPRDKTLKFLELHEDYRVYNSNYRKFLLWSYIEEFIPQVAELDTKWSIDMTDILNIKLVEYKEE